MLMEILTVRHEMPSGGMMDSARSAVAKVIAAKRRKRRELSVKVLAGECRIDSRDFES